MRLCLNSPGANEVMSISTGTAQPKSARPISISPDGTEDTKLYGRGLPDFTVGPWQMEDIWDRMKMLSIWIVPMQS